MAKPQIMTGIILAHLPNVCTGNDTYFSAESQGLTLVHFFAQPDPFLSLKPAKHPTTWDRKCSR